MVIYDSWVIGFVTVSKGKLSDYIFNIHFSLHRQKKILPYYSDKALEWQVTAETVTRRSVLGEEQFFFYHIFSYLTSRVLLELEPKYCFISLHISNYCNYISMFPFYSNRKCWIRFYVLLKNQGRRRKIVKHVHNSCHAFSWLRTAAILETVIGPLHVLTFPAQWKQTPYRFWGKQSSRHTEQKLFCYFSADNTE